MRFLLIPLALAIFLFGGPLQAQTNGKWSLEKCIYYAQQNNLTARQAAVTQQLAKNDNLQSKLNLLPNIDATVSYNFNFGNSLNPVTYTFVESNSQSGQAYLQANLPLFTGLQQIHNIQRTKYELLASQFDYETVKNNIALSVSSAFLQVLLNKEILGVLQKQRDLTALQKTTTESKVKAGALPENTLYETEAQLARDEANIVNAKGVYDVSILTLKQLLQLPETEPFEIDIPEVNADMIQGIGDSSSLAIYNYAVNTQPSILGAQARVKSADVSRKIALGNFSPTLSAFSSLSTGYFSKDQRFVLDTNDFNNSYYRNVPFSEQMGNNFRKVVGVQLAIPIFGKGQRFINTANARLQTQIRNLQLEGAKNTLRQDIEQAYANARAAAETYFANKKSYESAKKSVDALNRRFENGLLGTFELQQSKNTLAAAEAEMAKAKYTYVFRLKVLDFYQGKPITLN